MDYTKGMGIRYTNSSAKHDLTEEQIVWVMMHAVLVENDEDRYGRAAKRFVGPVHGQTSRLAEVIVAQEGTDFVVFHAMETGERLR